MNVSHQQAATSARKKVLIAQAEAQRDLLASNIEPLRLPLQRVELALRLVHFVRNNPAVMVMAGTVLAVLRSGLSWGLLRRSWLAWRFMPRSHDRSP